MGLLDGFFGDGNTTEKIIAFFELDYRKSGSTKTTHTANGEEVSFGIFKDISFSKLILKTLKSKKISVEENGKVVLLNGKVENLGVEFYVVLINVKKSRKKEILTFGWINKKENEVKGGPKFDSMADVLANLSKLKVFWDNLTITGIRTPK